MNYKHLLNEYRTLWNNRMISAADNAEMSLKEAIERELKDENSHPRVRKSSYQKFYSAVKRVIDSNLCEQSKNALIEMHIEIMERITKSHA